MITSVCLSCYFLILLLSVFHQAVEGGVAAGYEGLTREPRLHAMPAMLERALVLVVRQWPV